MFILSSVSRGLKFWSENHTSIYENSESNVFKKINFLKHSKAFLKGSNI